MSEICYELDKIIVFILLLIKFVICIVDIISLVKWIYLWKIFIIIINIDKSLDVRRYNFLCLVVKIYDCELMGFFLSFIRNKNEFF